MIFNTLEAWYDEEPMITLTLTLPLPPRELHPNARVHWAVKARATKQYRKTAYCYALVAQGMARREWTTAELHMTWHMPDKRRRDPDGLVASMKAAIDGLVDAGILADDDRLVIYPPTICVDRERPRVEVTICPIDTAA